MPVDDDIRTMVRAAGERPTGEQRARMHPLGSVEVTPAQPRRRVPWVLLAAAAAVIAVLAGVVIGRDGHSQRIVTTTPTAGPTAATTVVPPTASATTAVATTTLPATTLPATTTTLDLRPIEQQDLVGRWRIDSTDVYVLLTDELYVYTQGCPQPTEGTWSLDGTFRVELTMCPRVSELDGATLSRTGSDLLATRNGTVHRLVPTLGRGDVDLASGALFGIVPRQAVDPERLTPVLVSRTGQPVTDTGWFTVPVNESGEDCYGGGQYRIVSAGDVHVLYRGAQTPTVMAWVIGDARASTIGDERIWSQVPTGEPSELSTTGGVTIAVGSARPTAAPWDGALKEPLADGGVRLVDAGATLGGTAYASIAVDADGIVTGFGAAVNGC